MTHIALLMVGLLTAADRAAPTAGGPCTGKEDLLAIQGKWTARSDVGRGAGIPASVAPDISTRTRPDPSALPGGLPRASRNGGRGLPRPGRATAPRERAVRLLVPVDVHGVVLQHAHAQAAARRRDRDLGLRLREPPDLVRRAAEDAPDPGAADVPPHETGRELPGPPPVRGHPQPEIQHGSDLFPGDARDPPGAIAAQGRDPEAVPRRLPRRAGRGARPDDRGHREVVESTLSGRPRSCSSGGIR